MRLFVALPLPPIAVERLTRLRLRLSAPDDGLRWSTPEQWHITLQFYGAVTPDQAQCLQQALPRFTGAAAALSLEELGCFAAKGILFVAVSASPALDQLHAGLCEVGTLCGLPSESRSFRPHITLARSKGRRGHKRLEQLVQPSLPAFGPPLHWTADMCLLLESRLRPQGAEYTVRARLPLQAQAGTTC